MRSGVIHHAPWYFSEAEREDGSWSVNGDRPQPGHVVGEFGASLAAALTFALLVCAWLSAAGISPP